MMRRARTWEIQVEDAMPSLPVTLHSMVLIFETFKTRFDQSSLITLNFNVVTL